MELAATSAGFLAAFAHEIASFLQHDGLRCLRCVSRLLSIVTTSHSFSKEQERRAQQVVAFVEQHALLAKDFRQLVQTPRNSAGNKADKKRTLLKISDGQLQPLLRDLVLVGLGVRASCLVDTCRLHDATIQRMLQAFAASSLWRAYGLHQLRAIRLAGNVFFVNVHEFVRLKSRDLAAKLLTVGLIDASATLKTPRAISLTSATRQELVRSLREIVGKLLASVRDPCEIISVQSANATALAGLLLCYPVVYHVDDGGSQEADEEDAFWATSDNCLSMCPLYLLQTSITVVHGDTSYQFPLQEFSVPQQVADNAGVVPRLKSITTLCRRFIILAVGESTDRMSIHVAVTPRTLPQVAL